MQRPSSQRRRRRQRVLVASLILLGLMGGLLLAASRPEARGAEPAEALPGKPHRVLPFALPSGARVRLDDGDQEPAWPFSIKLVDTVSRQPLASRSASIGFRHQRLLTWHPVTTSEHGLIELGSLSRNGAEAELVGVRLDGYPATWLSEEHRLVLLETGAVTLELEPLAQLTARVLDAAGEPVEHFDLCYQDDPEDEEASCHSGTDGEVTVNNIRPGQHLLFWARGDVESSDPDQSRPLGLAMQSLQLAPGESRQIELRLAASPGRLLTVRVVDRAGRPGINDLVELELSPRQAPDTPAGRALVEETRRSRDEQEDQVAWRVQQPGWYRVRATPQLGLDESIGEIEVHVGEAETQASLVITAPLVRCRLTDPRGQPVAFAGYRLSFQRGDETNGFGGGGSEQEELAFYWPPKTGSVKIQLSGRSSRGQATLSGPSEPCRLIAQASSQD